MVTYHALKYGFLQMFAMESYQGRVLTNLLVSLIHTGSASSSLNSVN